MRDITNAQRNTCICITCDYFKRSGIHLVPDMFHETDQDDYKFIIQDAWLEYILDIEDLSIRYTVSISTMQKPERFVVNITNNGGMDHVNEYETFEIHEHLMQQYISDDEGYKEEVNQNPVFSNWL
ncbi:hypothetical protein VSVS05_00517 [Vibrio scophthalmi]|uniref:Uncharacterized protein n=2 Tax=Vibrionaceae TaxID=641 RepID=A0A1C7F6R3_9VIBR|nr:hypothetical protein VSVS05_00517 [Vibrio scophthalmi]